MHRALLVQDIVYEIVEHVSPETLTGLARTATVFVVPASRRIWGSISDRDGGIVTLARMFLKRSWRGDQVVWSELSEENTNLTEEWTRFCFYTSCVRQISFSSMADEKLTYWEVDVALWELSGFARSRGLIPLFPNLDSITANPIHGGHLRLLLHIRTPTLTSLELTIRLRPRDAIDGSQPPSGFLKAFVHGVPGIRRLVIRFQEDGYTGSIFHTWITREDLAEACADLDLLETVQVDETVFDGQLAAVLSKKKKLATLLVEQGRIPSLSGRMGTGTLSIPERIGDFLALRTVYLRGDLEALTNIVTCVRGPVTDMTLLVMFPLPSASFAELFVGVSALSLSLKNFELTIAIWDISPYQFFWKWICPLYACSLMERFVLRGRDVVRLNFEDAHVEALTQSWRSLQVFELDWPFTPQAQEMRMLRGGRLTLRALFAFAKYCPNICHIRMHGVDTITIPAANFFPPRRELKSLNLSFPLSPGHNAKAVASVIHALWPTQVIRFTSNSPLFFDNSQSAAFWAKVEEHLLELWVKAERLRVEGPVDRWGYPLRLRTGLGGPSI